MTATNAQPTVESLLQNGDWGAARELIERELDGDPDNHWLRTQLGVTFYEQGQYEEALGQFLISLDIVPDCPLTLWNYAGALDALGKHTPALDIYVWLLRCNKSEADDSCWESKAWADALKTDCVYRAGVCFRHLGRTEAGKYCFHQYLDLLVRGTAGSYSMEDVARELQLLQGKKKKSFAQAEWGQINSGLQNLGVTLPLGATKKPPKLSLKQIFSS